MNTNTKLVPSQQEYLTITFTNSNPNTQMLENDWNLPFQASNVFQSRIKSKRILTQGEDVKTVFEIRLDLANFDHKFEPGDTFGILPQNSLTEVDAIINRLNLTLEADKTYQLTIKDGKYKKPIHVPNTGTIRQVLQNNLDIRTVPKKAFLRSLLNHTTNPEEQNILNDLCAIQSKTYTQFIANERPTLLTLLRKFPSCSPPFTILLQNLPRLQPRAYSIASSPFLTPNEVTFIFSCLKLPNDCIGVCSGYLSQLEIGTNVRMYFRKSNRFRLPIDSKIGLILIGAGTGLAPFYSFLQHRSGDKSIQYGPCFLYYGCRYFSRDFLYRTELNEFLNDKVLTEFHTCFSRDGNEFKYVQHLIEKNRIDLIDLLEGIKVVVYVCGGMKMVKDVSEAFINCLMAVKNWTKENAENYLKELKKSNLFIEDVWI